MQYPISKQNILKVLIITGDNVLTTEEICGGIQCSPMIPLMDAAWLAVTQSCLHSDGHISDAQSHWWYILPPQNCYLLKTPFKDTFAYLGLGRKSQNTRPVHVSNLLTPLINSPYFNANFVGGGPVWFCIMFYTTLK